MKKEPWWVIPVKIIFYPIGAFFLGAILLLIGSVLWKAATTGPTINYYLICTGSGGTVWWLCDTILRAEDKE